MTGATPAWTGLRSHTRALRRVEAEEWAGMTPLPAHVSLPLDVWLSRDFLLLVYRDTEGLRLSVTNTATPKIGGSICATPAMTMTPGAMTPHQHEETQG